MEGTRNLPHGLSTSQSHPPPLVPLSLGVMISTPEFWGDTTIQTIAIALCGWPQVSISSHVVSLVYSWICHCCWILYLVILMWPSSVKLVSSFASFFLRTFHKTNNVFFCFPKLDASQASLTPFGSFPVLCWPVKHYAFGPLFFSKEKFLPDYSHRPNLACPVSYLHYSFSHQLLVSSR